MDAISEARSATASQEGNVRCGENSSCVAKIKGEQVSKLQWEGGFCHSPLHYQGRCLARFLDGPQASLVFFQHLASPTSSAISACHWAGTYLQSATENFKESKVTEISWTTALNSARIVEEMCHILPHKEGRPLETNKIPAVFQRTVPRQTCSSNSQKVSGEQAK